MQFFFFSISISTDVLCGRRREETINFRLPQIVTYCAFRVSTLT